MSEQIKFRKNAFMSFRTTTEIHIGSEEMDIPEDEIIEFDGSTLRWAGADYPKQAALRGAYKAGWIVLEEDQTTRYRPQPAGVKLRPAQAADSNERGEAVFVDTVDDEEKVIGSVKDILSREKKPRTVRGKQVIAQEDQEGVPVSRIKTQAKQTTKITDPNALEASIRAAENSTLQVERVNEKSNDHGLGDLVDASSGDHYPEPHVSSSAD